MGQTGRLGSLKVAAVNILTSFVKINEFMAERFELFPHFVSQKVRQFLHILTHFVPINNNVPGLKNE